MPKGYVIGRAKVTDATKWGAYSAKASEVMKIYGGTPIVRGGQMTVGQADRVDVTILRQPKPRQYAQPVK